MILFDSFPHGAPVQTAAGAPHFSFERGETVADERGEPSRVFSVQRAAPRSTTGGRVTLKRRLGLPKDPRRCCALSTSLYGPVVRSCAELLRSTDPSPHGFQSVEQGESALSGNCFSLCGWRPRSTGQRHIDERHISGRKLAGGTSCDRSSSAMPISSCVSSIASCKPPIMLTKAKTNGIKRRIEGAACSAHPVPGRPRSRQDVQLH